MGITFYAAGRLGDLLQRFKTGYLPQLSVEDLERRVILSVQAEPEGPREPKDSEWLKKKLIEVIENE